MKRCWLARISGEAGGQRVDVLAVDLDELQVWLPA